MHLYAQRTQNCHTYFKCVCYFTSNNFNPARLIARKFAVMTTDLEETNCMSIKTTNKEITLTIPKTINSVQTRSKNKIQTSKITLTITSSSKCMLTSTTKQKQNSCVIETVTCQRYSPHDITWTTYQCFML